MSLINFIIFVLFVIYVVFVWNSTKEFENIIVRVSYIFIGTIFITILTLILFWISKIGVEYPKREMVSEVQRIVLLVFIPINGFITLTQVASMFTQAKSGMVSKENMEKKLKRVIIIFIILIIIEIIYFKNIQNGMIRFIKCAKKNRSIMTGQKRTGPKCPGKKEPVPNARKGYQESE